MPPSRVRLSLSARWTKTIIVIPQQKTWTVDYLLKEAGVLCAECFMRYIRAYAKRARPIRWTYTDPNGGLSGDGPLATLGLVLSRETR